MGLSNFVDGGAGHYEWFNLSSSDAAKETKASDEALVTPIPYSVVLLKDHAVSDKYPKSSANTKYIPTSEWMKPKGKPTIIPSAKLVPAKLVPAKLIPKSKADTNISRLVEDTPKAEKDSVHYPWKDSSVQKILIIDLGNLRAKPPLWAVRMKLIAAWANQADHIFIAGQSGAVKLALPHLGSLGNKVVTIDPDNSADKYLLSEANKIKSMVPLQFLVMSNDHAFSQLANKGFLSVVTPKAETMSKVLKAKANIILDLGLAEEIFVLMPNKFECRKVEDNTVSTKAYTRNQKTSVNYNKSKKNNFNRKKHPKINLN